MKRIIIFVIGSVILGVLLPFLISMQWCCKRSSFSKVVIIICLAANNFGINIFVPSFLFCGHYSGSVARFLHLKNTYAVRLYGNCASGRAMAAAKWRTEIKKIAEPIRYIIYIAIPQCTLHMRPESWWIYLCFQTEVRSQESKGAS